MIISFFVIVYIMRKNLFISLFAISSLLSTSVQAHQADLPYSDKKIAAATLMIESKPQEACLYLEKNFDLKSTQDTDILYMHGQCSQANQQYDAAIDAYERILVIKPGAVAVKPNLAELYARTNQNKKAEAFLSELAKLESNKIGESDQRYAKALAQITSRKAQTKPWYITTEAGMLFDTNINAGPDDPQIILGGLPFTLPTSSQSEDSVGGFFDIGGGYSHALSQSLSVITQARYGNTNYLESNNVDSQYVSASSGVVYRDGQWLYSAGANVYWRTLEHDTYSRGAGGYARAAYSFSDDLSAQLSLGHTYNNYQVDDRDGTTTNAYAGLNHNIDEKTHVSAGLIASHDRTKDERFENTKYGVSAAATRVITPELKLTLNASYQQADYEGREISFGNRTRDDELYNAGVTAYYDISEYTNVSQTALKASAYYTRGDSNIKIYDYDRSTFKLSVSKTW